MARKKKKPRRVPASPRPRYSQEVIHHVVAYLCDRGRELMLERFSRSSCIDASRIGQEVLRHFGVQARLVPVKLLVWNEAATAAALQGGLSAEEFDVAGAYSFKIHGTGTLFPGGWDGHLVLIFPDEGGEAILDLSLDQAHLPEHGITPSPLFAELPPDFWKQGRAGFQPGPITVIYTRIASNGWKTLHPSEHNRPLVRRMLEELSLQFEVSP